MRLICRAALVALIVAFAFASAQAWPDKTIRAFIPFGAGSATDPAGAMIDTSTFARMASLGLDAKSYLDNNDATAFFAATGDLVLTGPTLTNVNDVRVILVDGE